MKASISTVHYPPEAGRIRRFSVRIRPIDDGALHYQWEAADARVHHDLHECHDLRGLHVLHDQRVQEDTEVLWFHVQ